MGLALAAYAAEPGFIDLFDGKTTQGWTLNGGSAEYTVADGVITGRGVPGTPGNTFLCTEKEYENFIFKAEFKCEGGNSGVQFRSSTRPDGKLKNGTRVFGYQCEITSGGVSTGRIYDEGRRGFRHGIAWLDLETSQARLDEMQKAFRKGDWNEVEIQCVGPSIKTWINGKKVADIFDDCQQRGFFGLQIHAQKPGATPGVSHWRKIRIHELPPCPPWKSFFVKGADGQWKLDGAHRGDPRNGRFVTEKGRTFLRGIPDGTEQKDDLVTSDADYDNFMVRVTCTRAGGDGTGCLTARGRGWVASNDTLVAKVGHAKDGWNTVSTIAVGDRLVNRLNGFEVLDNVDPACAKTGRLGLQLPAGGTNDVCFRWWQVMPVPAWMLAYINREAVGAAYTNEFHVADVKSRATGFFRVEQIDDGGVKRWWVIDPQGRGFVVLGVDHVKYDGFRSSGPVRWPHREANCKKFPNVRDWETNAVSRLKAWGFNMMSGGPGRIKNNFTNSFLTAWGLKMGLRLCYADKVDKDLWITPSNEFGHCSAFPNVFNPGFAAHCDRVAQEHCARHRGNPWIFGYYIDNELAWWGRGGKSRKPTGLFDATMALDDAHTAKIALRKFLKERGVTGEATDVDKIAFLELLAEKYFSITTAAIRRHDPDHMILGVRFAGLTGAPHEVLWRIAGKYCDIITFNNYPWADLNRGVVYVNNEKGALSIAEAFKKRAAWAQKPLMITEWAFPALDSGLPNISGAGQRFWTQRERVAAAELYARTVLSLPFMVGYDYFMWVDGETNYGLIDNQGEPYRELVEMFARVNRDAAKLRRAETPKEKTPRVITAHDVKNEFAQNDAVTFEKKDGEYVLRNAAGLVLKGKIGGKNVFDSVEYKGRKLGYYNVRLGIVDENGKRQSGDLSHISDVQLKKENGLDVLIVVGDGLVVNSKFRLTNKFVLDGDSSRVLCELVKIENIGESKINVDNVRFRGYVSYENAMHKWNIGFKERKNLWPNPWADYWVIPHADGDVFYGCLSRAPTVINCRYHVSKNKIVHPDMEFTFKERLILDASDSHEIDNGGVWMIGVCGEGGIKEWENQFIKKRREP